MTEIINPVLSDLYYGTDTHTSLITDSHDPTTTATESAYFSFNRNTSGLNLSNSTISSQIAPFFILILLFIFTNEYNKKSVIDKPKLKMIIFKYNISLLFVLFSVDIWLICSKINPTYILAMNIFFYILLNYYIYRQLD
jgi:hypothetical protein